MSLRWPALELLQRRGDLIALSPLSQDAARRAMTAALRRIEPALAGLADSGPDVAILEALAACIEVMGFYHDRLLTESKLGSAQLLDDLGRIVALIGYRPLPSVAATAYQFFEALTAGSVGGGTRVAGSAIGGPGPVTFETDALIEIDPALNRMALSPLITRAAGALRAVVRPLVPGLPAAATSQIAAAIAARQAGLGEALPITDFRPRTRALVADAQGLELVPIADSRSRAVAFGRPLTRSFDAGSAMVSRATVIRRLRNPRALGDGLVGFEVSEAPILHQPRVAAPELLDSTLEVFVLRPGDEALDPSEWSPALRYTEVPDFSGSEVTDLHHRTFVDDALHTWILLRTRLGAHELLSTAALDRVFARFVPAIGSVLPAAADAAPGPDGPSELPALGGVTLGLDAGYFETSVVVPPVPDTRLAASATWAMVDRDLGLVAGDAILIQDDAGRWVRTLIERAPGASPRLLRWAADPATGSAHPATGAELREAHAPVPTALDPASAKIAALVDAATGDALPTWSEFYAQLRPPTAFVPATDFPIAPASPAGLVERQRVVAAGTTYLVLRDASHIAPGDFFLLGRRLVAELRAVQPFGGWRVASDEAAFDPRTPWLSAEVVQALEVRGSVIRLATPVSQDYHVHRGRQDAAASEAEAMRLSEVVALPGVVAAAAGDRLRQTLSLATQPMFQGDGADHPLYDASYTSAALDRPPERPYTAGELRRPLIPAAAPRPDAVVALPGPRAAKPPTAPPPVLPGPAELWQKLFVAVAGVAELQVAPDWTFDIRIRAECLRAPAEVFDHLEDGAGAPITGGDIAGALADGGKLRLVSAAAAAAVAGAADGAVTAVLAQPPRWRRVDAAPATDEFRVVEVLSFDVIPDPPDLASEAVLGGGGALILTPPPAGVPAPFRFTWDAIAKAPRVTGEVPAVAAPFEALLVSDAMRAAFREPDVQASVDWVIPRARFHDPGFADAAAAAGRLVIAGANQRIALEWPAAPADPDDPGVRLSDVGAAVRDPLAGGATAWAVLPGDLQIPRSAVQARWSYQLAPGAAALPPSTRVSLALFGGRRALVPAETTADGRSAAVDPALGVQSGDLGFALDLLCVLDGSALPGARIAASTIWAWQGIHPAPTDLPEPADSQFVAVLPGCDGDGLDTIAWRRDEVWWDPARRTLRLSDAPLADRPARPSDVVRLIQVLAPPVDHRRLAITYDPATDRSLVTAAMPAGWPAIELAPAPVVIGAPVHRGRPEVRDAIAVDVATEPDGGARWTLQFAGDLRDRWRSVGFALRDWSAPAGRGLAAAPIWRVAAPPVWRARAAGPLRLVATAHDRGELIAIAALARLAGDAVELAPLGPDDEFPDAATVDQLDLPIHTAAAAAGAPLALRGTTVVELSGLTAPLPPTASVVFSDGDRWTPIPISAQPDGSYQLGVAYLSLFPDGIAAEQRVRLCTQGSAIEPAPPARPRTLRLRIPGLAGGPLPTAASAAVFFTADDLGDRIVLDTASPPRLDGGALVVELAIGAGGLGTLVGDARPGRIALAQRWPGLAAIALVPQPFRVELGGTPRYPLAVHDVIALGPPGSAARARIHALAGGVLDLTTDAPLAADQVPAEIALHGLRTQVDPADYFATLELTPSSEQPPWLFGFTKLDGASLRETLLPYAATERIGDGTRRRLRFERTPRMAEIFGSAGGPLYLYRNERDELRREFYTKVDKHIADDLGQTPPPNFLDAPDSAPIDRLILTATAWAGTLLDPSRAVMLGSIDWAPPSYGVAELPADRFPEVVIVRADARRVATRTVLQSLRFPTGNFIPVAGQGATPADTAALIASALRISARPVDRRGAPIPGQDWRTVDFVALGDLAATRDTAKSGARPAAPGSATRALEGMTFRDALDSLALDANDARYVFSASFAPVGGCTLHFWFVDEELIEAAQVRIEAQYEVTPGRTGNGLGDPIYPLETPVAPFDPATRLALLAPGELKPGALVFVRQPAAAGVPDLQWTRVTDVAGSIVAVAPPLVFAPGPGASPFEPIAIAQLGKLAGAARLDTDYYQTVAKARLTTAGQLALRDRLPLDALARPAGGDASLLAALIPGDRVLIYDERKRRAWSERRRTGSPDDHSTAWRQWPDFQHEAVVKRVDAETGLLVLAAPLPDRFQIRWELAPATRRLTPVHDDVAALRVLPHHRAPVQGPRTLRVLGSGDATRRFARFATALDAATGSAVLPLDAAGVTAGNLEVLAFDPEKGTWIRWLRHDALSRAGKKDAAFTLGFRATEASGAVPVSVTFGDGLTGRLLPTGSDNVYLRATRIGAPAPWLLRRRPVRIVRRGVPDDAMTTGIALEARLESAGPDELTGARDLGAAQFRPALELEVAPGGGAAPRVYPQISAADAARGAHGFVVQAGLDLPPGVVDVELHAPPLADPAAVTAWHAPGTRQWALDAGFDDSFYTELARPDLTAAPGATALQLLSTTGLRTGSLLAVFRDADSPPDLVRIASIDPPTWSATIEPALGQVYDLERSFLRGNTARIVQGAVEQTTLGSSDGSTASLRLPLPGRAPLLYVARPGQPPEPDVTVVVAGQRWDRVLDFAGHGPASRVWRLDRDPDGAPFVVFGDGELGAIPPAGRDHIAATMRVGSGAAGNLAAGAIDKLVAGNLAVKSTRNLTASAGGSAGDTPIEAREKAFAHRLPSDRVVTADDCVRAAQGVSGVISAVLDPGAPTGELRLVVALDGRRAPTAEDLQAVRDRVAGAMPITARVQLTVAAAEQRAVHLVVELAVAAGALPATVFAAVVRALGTGPDGLFAAERWDIGEPLRLGAIYDRVFRVPGVARAHVVWMADTPLLEGQAAPGPAPDAFHPGATGVVRCDADPVADPFGRLGTIRLAQIPEAP